MEATVVTCGKIGNSDITSLTLSVPEKIKVEPGQFMMFESRVADKVLPRPFSVCYAEDMMLFFRLKVKGGNTQAYSLLRPDEKLNIRGPFGCAIPISQNEPSFTLVAGGIGYAGLIFLAHKLHKSGKVMRFLYGAKTESDLVDLDVLKRSTYILRTITDFYGPVTDLLAEELEFDCRRSTIIACGPIQMLKKVAAMTAKSGNKCLVGLEQMMACGIGSCSGCAVFGRDENGNEEVKHVCVDGPAFAAEWVNWNKIEPPRVFYLKKRMISGPVVLSGQNSRRLFLETPIMNASGCLKPGAIEQEQVDISDFGALITKGTTLLPQIGNPSPRICEGPSVLLNSIGLENLGVEEFAKQILPRWQKFGLPVIVNIAGKKVEDYVEIARRLKDEKIVGFEINVSCPNVGGKIIGKSSEETYSVVRAVRKVVPGGFGMFLIVKLSPAADDIVAVAKAAVGAGADAISAINTFPGMDIDIYTGQPKLGNVFGGVSGPGIVHMALKIVYDLCQAKLGVPIIGLGGIKNAESAIKFFMVGASAIQIGTELFRSPQGIPKIYQEMCQIAEKIGE